MLKILKNELIKVVKSKRLFIFTIIIVLLSVFFGGVVKQMENSGLATGEMLENMVVGYFPIQILGLFSDMILPIFATLLVCFLIIDEYNTGTLKLPILCGHSRNAIITAKILSVIIIMAYIMLITLVSANLAAVILWGTDGVLQMFFTNFKIYAQTFGAMVSWSLVMVLISLFLQNSGIMIGIMTVVLVVSSIVGNMFPEITKYIFTYYLKAFASQDGSLNNALGYMVCIITFVVFGTASFVRFHAIEIQK